MTTNNAGGPYNDDIQKYATESEVREALERSLKAHSELGRLLTEYEDNENDNTP